MFILPGSIYGLKNVHGANSFSAIFIQNRAFLDRSQSELVVVTGCIKVFNIDFKAVAEQHSRSGAGITMIYKKDIG